ncbi:MAG: aminoacyl-tRNA hydrolase [Rhodospirillales bacterium]|nr:aminoacyl-tRNA hydrolase [Rhodospirillales bacterium]MCB9973564.1 aminoacyl-tRNA hydrolase [Rhodospirillales bacterium]MCB9979632.1 aminoacyl-tRNA hydrolase [Rhodospirillales bacterium]
MILLVGLGNPGQKYEKNRHNIGFMAIDQIAQEHRAPSFRNKFQSDMSEASLNGVKVILQKPLTFMNESGQAVQALSKFYKIPPSQIFVFHDELDLEPGKVRFKTGGGNAGHNGLKSIQAHLGAAEFHRIRLGIGHPGHKDKVHAHVLSNFAKADQVWLESELRALSDHLPLLLDGQSEEYMSKVAKDIQGQA